MSNSRIYTGYLLECVEGEKVHHVGPFATETRAEDYQLSCPSEWRTRVIPLTIPHSLHVYVETQY